MKMQKKLWVTIFLVLAVSAAQAQFGDIFKKGIEKAKRAKDTFQPWSPEQEDAVGQASAAKLIHVFGLYDENPEIVRYVNLVGNTVARSGARKDIQYHFGILNTDILSAFALPGGYIFVTRGALANMQNEAQLAGVLSHEVAHVDGRHLEKEIRDKKATKWAVEEGTAKVPSIEELRSTANQLITNALTSSYPRDKEDEADKKGLEFATNAGYDPAGLRDFLKVLAAAAQDPTNNRRLGLWNNATHPPFEERVARLEKLMSGKSGGQELADRYKQEVDFTKKPASEAQEAKAAAPAGAGQNPCSLEDAKARIAYERESLDSLNKPGSQPKTKAPANCSLEQAKAKIEEARALLDSVDSSSGSASASGTKSGPAKPATKTTAASKKTSSSAKPKQ